MSVNDRLRQQVTFLEAQNQQFRIMMGVLVHRLGGSAVVSEPDFVALREQHAEFLMEGKPGAVGDDGIKAPDVCEMRLLTGEDAAKFREERARIEPARPSLIVTGR